MGQLAVHTIDWSDFDQEYVYYDGDQRLVGINGDPLPDGDHIWLSLEEGAAIGIDTSSVRVVLETAPNVTWYKEIRAYNRDQDAVASISTQDAFHGPAVMNLVAQAVDCLVFTKAKFLGIHTGMYVVFDVAGQSGRQLTFRWTSD